MHAQSRAVRLTNRSGDAALPVECDGSEAELKKRGGCFETARYRCVTPKGSLPK